MIKFQDTVFDWCYQNKGWGIDLILGFPGRAMHQDFQWTRFWLAADSLLAGQATVLSKTKRPPPIFTSFHVFSYFSCLCTCFHMPMIKIHPSFCFCPWLSKTFVSSHIAVGAYPRPLTSLWSQGTLRISCVSNSDSYVIMNQCQFLCSKTS